MSMSDRTQTSLSHALVLRTANCPVSMAGPIAVRSTQFGAGEMVVVMGHTIRQTGYGFPPSCTRLCTVCTRSGPGGAPEGTAICYNAFHILIRPITEPV